MESKSLSRRDFMKGCAATSTAAILGSGLAPRKIFAGNNGKKPNIVLYVSDDHGLDALGCYGNPIIKTPNMDSLAAEGVRFTNAFCTSASCSASRSVILSGMYNHANGRYGHQHGYHHFVSFDKVKSLPVLLSEAGYRTARAGKLHVAPDSVYKFDVTIKAHQRSLVEMADKCKDFIKEDNPFFLYICPSDPHRSSPYRSNLKYGPNLFGNNGKDGYKGIKEVEYDPKDVIVPPYLPDTPHCRAELAQYYQAVSRLDRGIGQLIQNLKDAGKYENTIFIYLSDNGIAFPGCKTTLYEPGMHLPCIFRIPSQKNKNIACDALVNYADLAPTILDLAGVPKHSQFQGKSFKSVLEQEKTKGWDETYASHTFHEITMYYPMRVVRERKYKLIWNIAHKLDYPFATDLWDSAAWQGILESKSKYYGQRTVDAYLHRPEFELYDLEKDPYEAKNLADDSKYKETLDRLKEKMKAFQKKTRDPWIIKWSNEDVFGGQSTSGL